MLVSIFCECCLHVIVVFVVQHITVHLYDFMVKYVCWYFPAVQFSHVFSSIH